MEKYLSEFIDLAETCSFQETAERLFISQSTLSKHISTLELELGVSLFDRSTRSVSLSNAGSTFYEYAKKMVALQVECRETLVRTEQKKENQIHIGAIGFMHYYRLHTLLDQYSDLHPDITVRYTEGEDSTLIDLLASEKTQFCITAAPQLYEPYNQELFYRDYLVVVLAKDHPLHEFQGIHVNQLRNEKFIVHSPKFEFSVFWHFCQAAGYKPIINSEISFNSTIIKLVARNAGITIMTNKQAQNVMRDDVVAIPLSPMQYIDIFIVFKKGKKLRPEDQGVLSYLLDSARKLSESDDRAIDYNDTPGE